MRILGCYKFTVPPSPNASSWFYTSTPAPRLNRLALIIIVTNSLEFRWIMGTNQRRKNRSRSIQIGGFKRVGFHHAGTVRHAHRHKPTLAHSSDAPRFISLVPSLSHIAFRMEWPTASFRFVAGWWIVPAPRLLLLTLFSTGKVFCFFVCLVWWRLNGTHGTGVQKKLVVNKKYLL